MRIAIVTNYLPPRAGGLEGVVDALAREYSASGDDVVVVGLEDRSGAAPYRREVLRGWNPLERRGVPVPILSPASLVRVWRTVRAADAVHIHGLVFLSSFAALLARRRNQPVVVTEHVGLIPFDSAVPAALQRMALRTGAVLATRRRAVITVLNDRVARDVESVAPRAQISKIPNGVDVDTFSPVTPSARASLRAKRGWGAPTVLVVARNTPKKRLDLVRAAAERLPDVRFVVCGLDTEKLEWTLPNVDVEGAVERAILADHYRAADMLLLPSEGEGQPLSVLEALSSGLPVALGADAPVFAELPDCVVPVERNVDAVVEAVSATIPPPSERERVAQRCVAAVGGRSWHDVAMAYRTLLVSANATGISVGEK